MKHVLLLFAVLLITMKLFAQSLENGSFENKNNWELNIAEPLAPGFQQVGFRVETDTKIFHNGLQSVYITKDSSAVNASFGCFRQVIKGNFQGKKIKLSGWIKTNSISSGAATLWYELHNADATDLKDMNPSYITGTNEWKRYEMELIITQPTDRISIGGLLMGDGEAWFDDFTITGESLVTDTDITAARNIVKQNSFPLSVINNIVSANELIRIFTTAKSSKIIGLGEVTHGTSEAYTSRMSMSRFLIEKRGFTIICLENSYGWTERMNEYIQTGKGNLDSLMHNNLLGMWQNEEMKTFFTWLKDYNKTHMKKVYVKGMDYSQLEPDVAILKRNTMFLRDDSLKQWSDTLQGYLSYIDSAYHDYTAQGFQPDFKKVVNNFNEGYLLIRKIEDRLRTCKKKISASVIQQTEAGLLNMKLACYNFYRVNKEGKSEMSRDSIMFEMVKRFAREKTGTKIIIWAHNAHIAKRSLYVDSNGGGMGGLVKKFYPNQYYAIGMGTANGAYAATNDGMVTEKSKFSAVAFDQPTEGSWELLLSQETGAGLYISLNSKKNLFPLLYHRVIGQVPMKGREPYVKVKLDELYDGFLFIQNTISAKSF